MTTYKTREIPLPLVGCVPTYKETWGAKDRDRWMQHREHHFMPWNNHVVAEGIVDNNDMNLRRALRENGVELES